MQNFDKYKGKGQTGLANVGNTCYVNSLLQCLSHTYELNDFLETNTFKERLNANTDALLLVEWNNLRKLMWSKNCNIAPWGFVKAIQKVASLKHQPLFTGYEQNDVQEFLLFIIECFHNSISREVDMEVCGPVLNSKDVMAKKCFTMMRDMFEKDYSEIVQLFYGIHVSIITELNTETDNVLSAKPEPFMVLSLPLPSKEIHEPTIYSCIDEFCNKDTLEGENSWFNEDTNEKQPVYKGMVFWSFPEILIVHLKRWNYTGKKDQRLVTVPLENLDLTQYIKGYNPRSYIYDLYGVCNHHGGGPLSGHYTANVKNADGQWYNFNDMSISKIDGDKVVNVHAYCLFFRKKIER